MISRLFNELPALLSLHDSVILPMDNNNPERNASPPLSLNNGYLGSTC